MELVFETDGEAVEWSDSLVVFGVVVVQVLGPIERFVEEDFVEAIVLQVRLVIHLEQAETYDLMGNSRRLAKGGCNLCR